MLAVQDARLRSHRDRPECTRDCGLRTRTPTQVNMMEFMTQSRPDAETTTSTRCADQQRRGRLGPYSPGCKPRHSVQRGHGVPGPGCPLQ